MTTGQELQSNWPAPATCACVDDVDQEALVSRIVLSLALLFTGVFVTTNTITTHRRLHVMSMSLL
jgi:hypothetical protein